MSELMARVAPLAIGYGLYQTASSTGYLSAMGTVEASVGFASQLPFMTANALTGALTMLALVVAASRGRRLGPSGIWVWGYLLIALVTLAGWLVPTSATNALGTAWPILLGSVRGAGSAAVMLTWFALFVSRAGSNALPIFTCAFAIHGLLGLALGGLAASWVSMVLVLGLLVISFSILWRLRSNKAPTHDGGAPNAAVSMGRGGTPSQRPARHVSFSGEDGRILVSAWLCMLVCHFVIGIANTAVLDSSLSGIMAGVNVSLCVLLAAIAVGLASALTRRTPAPESVFAAALPVLLVVFSLVALAADTLGLVAGYAMIVCYEAIALAYSVFLVSFLARGGYEPYWHVGLTAGISNLMLAIGFGVGVALNALWSSRGVPLAVLVAFVAIYPLGLAFMYIQRTRSRRAEREERDAAVAQALEEQMSQIASDEAAAREVRLDKLASMSGLTKRERQACDYLLRGFTVRSAADAMGISENTAWTHVRNAYAKCGVGTRQELVEIFERIG